MRTKSRPAVQQPSADLSEVKRRFIRQNRELAKSNSSQSLQIRNLQLESSRLLAENLGLRERVVHLEKERRELREGAEVIDRYHDDLRRMVAGLTTLLDRAGDVKMETTEDEGPLFSNWQRSMHGSWRERVSLIDAMRDHQMPTITEDKHFPRRTLGREEVLVTRLSDQSSGGSPDIGPPPVAHFNYGDTSSKTCSGDTFLPLNSVEDPLAESLSANLEVRKKKKESFPKMDFRCHSILAEQGGSQALETPGILRTGAKRKLADRELDAPVVRATSQEKFAFNRKLGADSKIDDIRESVANSKQSPRKVLGEKSVNLSPRKRVSKSDKAAKAEIQQEPGAKTEADKRKMSRERRASSIPVPSPPHGPNQVVIISLEPEIEPQERPMTPPVAPDIFSPASALSTGPSQSRDTPPPTDLTNVSTISTASETSRPSRRARSAVNYAEPNLVAKMRRPGKEMADAVTGLQGPRRAMGTSGDNRFEKPAHLNETSQDQGHQGAHLTSQSVDVVNISTLGLRSPSGETADDRSSQTTSNIPKRERASSSSKALSALIESSQKRRNAAVRPETDNDLVTTTKQMSDIDLYEFPDSSSPTQEDDVKAPSRTTSRTTSRRHTMTGKDKLSEPTAVNTDVLLAKSKPVPANVKVERTASRRRSMMV